MKIVKGQHHVSSHRQLQSFDAGQSFRFCTALPTKHRISDVFIVNSVCSSYQPELRGRGNVIAVTNLRSGALGYFEKHRECEAVNCEVTTFSESCCEHC